MSRRSPRRSGPWGRCSSGTRPPPRSGTTWPARTTCSRPEGPPDTRARCRWRRSEGGWRGSTCPRTRPRSSRRPVPRSPGRRASRSMPSRWSAASSGSSLRAMSRTATLSRTTSETEITVTVTLDGEGAGERRTGIGFFDHMLDALARHGRLDRDVEAGAHHTVEDTGLLLGRALDEALGDRAGIARFGDATVPMDEARASATIDLSGRPLSVFEARRLPSLTIGGFETELCEEFMRAVSSTARMTLHVRVDAGRSAHHMIEAAFKAFARALRAAVALDEGAAGTVPSTKGVL